MVRQVKSFKLTRLSEPSENELALITGMARITLGDFFKIESSHNYWLVYDRENSPVGFAGLDINKMAERPYAFLSWCGVLKEARGNGLQKRLIQARVRYGRRLGMERFVTYTSPDNVASANNLIRCGFLRYTPDNPYGVENASYWKREF